MFYAQNRKSVGVAVPVVIVATVAIVVFVVIAVVVVIIRYYFAAVTMRIVVSPCSLAAAPGFSHPGHSPCPGARHPRRRCGYAGPSPPHGPVLGIPEGPVAVPRTPHGPMLGIPEGPVAASRLWPRPEAPSSGSVAALGGT